MSNYRTGISLFNIALIRLIIKVNVTHNTVSVCIGQELRAITEQTACRYEEFEMRHTALARTHIAQLGVPCTEAFHDRADILLRDFYHKKLNRFKQFTVIILFINNRRRRNLELVTLTPHRFN